MSIDKNFLIIYLWRCYSQITTKIIHNRLLVNLPKFHAQICRYTSRQSTDTKDNSNRIGYCCLQPCGLRDVHSCQFWLRTRSRRFKNVKYYTTQERHKKLRENDIHIMYTQQNPCRTI